MKIVLISINDDNAKQLCKQIENKTFFNDSNILDEIKKTIPINLTYCQVLSIPKFIEFGNNGEIYLDDYFLSYINIVKN